MALETIAPNFGKGHARLAGQLAGSTHNILQELQGLRISVATGAAANTNIAVAGIATDDTLLSVVQFTRGAVTAITMSDVTSTASITSAGNIQLSAASTGHKLIVVWFDKSGTHLTGLEDISPFFGKGEAQTYGDLPNRIYRILRELQNLRISTISPTSTVSSTTDLALVGITTSDTILSVVRYINSTTATSIDVAEIGSTFSIPSDGNVRTSGTVASGDHLIVFWYDKFGGHNPNQVSTIFSKGQAQLHGQLQEKSLYYYLRELRALNVDVVAGAAADTNIAISGISTEDRLLGVVRLEDGGATAGNFGMDTPTDARITSNGNIQFDTTVTTDDALIVFWYDKSGA